MRWPDTNAGFTLLELIISLTIVAIIAVMVQNGFKLSVGAWEKGEAAVEDQQRYRYVLDLIQRQISSVVPTDLSAQGRDGLNRVFRGDEASLVFSSRISLMPFDSLGMVRVQYRVETEEEGKSLSFIENSLLDRLRGSFNDEPEEEDWHTLLSGVYDFAFEYLTTVPPEDPSDDTSFLKPSWERKGLPLALRARFQAEEASSPLYLVIPIGKGK